uniref:Uncharacterized protein n=1 Tax=Anopheles melas TaxID=34690 RepID=A0A182U5F3_9DIPT
MIMSVLSPQGDREALAQLLQCPFTGALVPVRDRTRGHVETRETLTVTERTIGVTVTTTAIAYCNSSVLVNDDDDDEEEGQITDVDRLHQHYCIETSGRVYATTNAEV